VRDAADWSDAERFMVWDRMGPAGGGPALPGGGPTTSAYDRNMAKAARRGSVELSPERLLGAYANGFFPMADDRGRVGWYTADPRAIIDLDRFHVPRTLRQVLRRRRFAVTVNTAFEHVIRGCASRPEGSWINDDITAAYVGLHRLGYAHSIEAAIGGELAGGLYGVSIGGAFFGESMFHLVTDASKVALCALVDILIRREFVLLDIQFLTEHLRRFGAIDIPAQEYLRRLRNAIALPRSFMD